MARGDISLADLYRSFKALEPDNEAGQAITHLLGIENVAAATSLKVDGAYHPGQAPGQIERSGPSPHRADDVPGLEPDYEPGPRGWVFAARLETRILSEKTAEPPAWLATVKTLPAAPSVVRKPSPPEPLFERLRERAILGAALATPVPEGEPDIDKITECRSRLEPLAALPRRSVPTLRLGVQVLLDHSEAMTPYAADREQIAAAITDIGGRSRVEVLRFRECPGRGVVPLHPSDRKRGPASWSSPPRGTVVAVVSDLGLGGSDFQHDRATREEWLEFAGRARRAGCPVVAFIPFSPHRWDKKLTKVIAHVYWDRTTSAGAVRHAIGAGHEAP